jgi:hypothetical protein
MIDDDVVSPGAAQCIVTTAAIDHAFVLIPVAHAKAEVTDNNVVSV